MGATRCAGGRVVVGCVLKAATGPLAEQFHWLGNASWIGTLDLVVASALVAVGLSLMLGLFTQTGCLGALGLLSMFYLSAIPMGLPEARAEGTYLIVNKNLIEAAAVLVLLSFRTGEIAGLDQLWRASRVRSDRAAFARVENRDLTPTKEMSL